MKIIFFGTPRFAVPSLQMLVNEKHEVLAVGTQPDKPKGRGRKIEPPAVKIAAGQLKLPVLQPRRTRDEKFVNHARTLAPDAICVVSYGQLLPDELLEIPRIGAINVHTSLLPKYRGAAPINWAVINGDTLTGVTTMLMSSEMDAGDILLQEEVPIEKDDTADSLFQKMAPVAADLLARTLKGLEEGWLSPTPQDHSAATYAPKLTREMANIDWSRSSLDIHNLVRGTDPWPGAYTYYEDQTLKIWKTEPAEEENGPDPGTIIEVGKDGLIIQTGEGRLCIKEVQLENRKRMTVKEFIQGHSLRPGIRFHR